jgi:4-methylaminobutanoate oxidase (formaldehyde-forming)
MEKGYRYYGTDLTLLDNPFEAGLGFCVRLDKGEFNGREALAAAREAGVKRRLRTLAVGGEQYLPVYGGEAVRSQARVVSRLRSSAYGFTVRKNLAYAYLPVELKPGSEVEVEVFGEMVPAVVTSDSVIAKRAEQPAS